MAANPEDERSEPVQPPCFFKIILFPIDQELRIPRAFMRKCGRDLEDTVTLKVPTGASWKVELVHYGDGTRLRKGWKEFAEYYSVRKSFFLVFRYDGNSQFLVFIFGPNALEIKYPTEIGKSRSISINPNPRPFNEFLINPQAGQRNSPSLGTEINGADDEADDISVVSLETYPTSPASNGAPPVEEEDTEDDVSVQVLDDLSHRKSNPLPRPRTRSSHGHLMTENLLSKRKKTHTNPYQHTRSNGNKKAKQNQVKSPSPISIPNYAKESSKEESKAYRKAKSFRSSDPFFIHFVQPSSVSGLYALNIPSDFENEYLNRLKDCKLILYVSGKMRKWPVILRVTSERVKLGTGWRKFAEDNGLKVGDVCVFELVRFARIFNITVFPSTCRR